MRQKSMNGQKTVYVSSHLSGRSKATEIWCKITGIRSKITGLRFGTTEMRTPNFPEKPRRSVLISPL